MSQKIRYVVKSTPYRRPGLGMALWAFMVWLMVVIFKATVVVAKYTALAVAFVVAAIVGWVESRK